MIETNKIKDSINIQLESYNIQTWERTIIEKCLEDNPSSTHEELAKLLGMSERNFYRICKLYSIDITITAKNKLYHKMVTETSRPTIR